MSHEARNQPDPDPLIDDIFTGQVPILDALEKLRLRLLDLSRRNRLLNFKHSPGKCIQLVAAHPDLTFHRLVESQDKKIMLRAVPDPPRIEWIDSPRGRVKPEVKDYARKLGIDPSFELASSEPQPQTSSADQLQTLHYPEDLERHCRKLQREMKSGLEETGAHMLFLVFGFLEFPDDSLSERMMLAPLISVPVILEKGELDRGTRRYRYNLFYTGDEVADNLSLKEKLRQDHGYDLPVFDPDVTKPDAYFNEIKSSIKTRHGWKLRRQMTLCLLSFTKMLLVRDIDPTQWPTDRKGRSALTDHPIVRMVFEGVTHGEGGTAECEQHYDIDNPPHSDVPLIYDADSSQHSALIDALSGRNMVIEGPPGTGKSQTITNLVAAAISQGKTVLFLSEKMAALEVVKKRLSLAGLGDFCLELHSNKTHKKHVLEAIANRKNRSFPFPRGLQSQLNALEEKRRTLKGYADLVNSEIGNAQGLSMHSIIWRAECFRLRAGNE